MTRAIGIRLLSIAAIVAIAGVLLYSLPMNLGLDLQGGVQVVLEAQDTETAQVNDDAMERAHAVIDRRVNALGVSEPVIQRQGSRRIIVELPGIDDHEQAIDAIGRTALLEFKDPLGNTILTGSSLRNASVTRDEMGRWAIAIEFDREGTQVFAELTRRWVNTGRGLPIVFDGEEIIAPMVSNVILDGQGIITGGFTAEEARTMAVLLRSGSLPVPMEVVEIRNVGPILGQESIERSIQAGIIGIILVLIFMLAYYRLPGGMADIALGLYVVLVLGVLTGMRATLTLPGIAGLVLSIGMAVDANVIIFERVKEELQAGKRLRAAIQAGWNRAFNTILDSNLTSLITAAILFYFGTGPVRGFAVTLSVGIVVSMFTALFVTRTLLHAVVDRNPEGMVRYFGVKGAVAK